MNSPVREKLKLTSAMLANSCFEIGFLSPEEAAKALELVQGFEECRWWKVTSLDPGRYYKTPEASYSKSLNRSMGNDALRFFESLAPDILGFELDAVVVNRYQVGDFIPPHLDRDGYMYNVVIPLTSSDVDGFSVEGSNFPDEAGVGHVLKGKGVNHWVDPVNAERYTVMYLYL